MKEILLAWNTRAPILSAGEMVRERMEALHEEN